MWHAIKDFFLRFARRYNIFPCPGCSSGDGDGCNQLCPDCLAKLRRIESTPCPGCGGELEGVLAICPKCLREKKRPYLEAATLFHYSGFGKILIGRFKNNGAPELARAFADLAEAELAKRDWQYDFIVPVPLHWYRELRRGYNQSSLFAGELARRQQKPLKRVLTRIKLGKTQKTLSSAARHRNLHKAFRVRPSQVQGKRILLIDDVFTTGATVSAGAAILQKCGSSVIYILTIARA